MALVATEHDPASRRRVIPVYLQHGTAGVLALLYVTVSRREETLAILHALGPQGPALIVLFLLFATTLALLKFPLTEQIFVSLVITAYIVMFPLLGIVCCAWIAAISSISHRLLGMLQIGPTKVDLRDPRLEWSRTFALFGTYCIPVIIAGLAYKATGGTVPCLIPSFASALRIAGCGILLVMTNNLIVSRVEGAYGYSMPMTLKLSAIDSSIYIVSLPYAILTTFAYGSLGLGGVMASAFTGVIGNAVARKLAVTRSDREDLIQRLASLTNIGRTISLSYSTHEVLMAIYTECRNIIDLSIFSIALVDNTTNELCFEINVDGEEWMPKTRLPIGQGLNSWVILNAKPLLVGSQVDERKFGVTPYDDGIPASSWLGVPMISRDQVLGVISVQSLRKNAFTYDDLVLLTAIANQAAVSIENAHLYKDLEGLNLALEQRVQERTLELREANVRLIAADRSKNQFLASMSHELRTPLNAIIGFSTILAESTQSVLPPRLFKFLQNIRTAGSHLLDLINDILDLAKIESGKLQLQTDSFDLRETIATVERVIKGMAAERDVTVVTSIDDDLSEVHLDEGRLKQILLNLLSNAVKFSHRAGAVQLTVRPVHGEESGLQCQSIRFDVADSGIGIPDGDVSRIFDEFYQVNDPSSRQKGGTGLGLSLTKSFVDLHHGRITVRSEHGVGSLFTIHLPRDYRDVAIRRADPAPILARP